MEFFDVLENRFSCREFEDKKVEKEKLDKILEAARLSPTAVNFQPEKIFVIESEEYLSKLSEHTRFTFGAKTVIVTAYDKRVSWHRKRDNYDHGMIDSAIITTNMMNACTALGLGSCFVCSMHAEEIGEMLGLDDNYVVVSLLPIGYPKKVNPHGPRKNIEDIVTYK